MAPERIPGDCFSCLLGIRELRLYDTDPEATAKLKQNLAMLRLTDLRIVPCARTAEAVRGADIVTTVTADKCNALILTPDMIRPGMHLNAVGGDCPGKTELHADILRRQDLRIVVEFEPQARIEGRYSSSIRPCRSSNSPMWCAANSRPQG